MPALSSRGFTMAKRSQLIETGVDKLIKLIEQEKKISIADAAKKLSIPRVVLEEWLDFLEQKEIVTIEYKFTTPYIVKRELTQKDIEKRTKTFSGQKEAFMRKADTLLQNINSESEGLNRIGEEFEAMSRDVEKDVKTVENDVLILERYESLKRNIDREIIAQQKEYENRLSKLNAALVEKGKSYDEMVENLRRLEMKLLQDKGRVESIQKAQENLRANIVEISNAIDLLNEELKKEDKDIEGEYEAIDRLKSLASRAKRGFEKKEEEIKGLIEKSREHETKIVHSQQDILRKVTESSKEIDTSVDRSERAKARFERFFSKKSEINSMLTSLNHQIEELEVELKELLASIKTLELTSKTVSAKKHIGDAEEHFNRIKEKKNLFEKELLKLVQLIRK